MKPIKKITFPKRKNENAQSKKISESLTYAYLRKIKKWIHCPNCSEGIMKITSENKEWECQQCGYKLSLSEFEDNYVFWFCDECNSYLNNQEKFDRYNSKHICTNCGYENDTTFSHIKGLCKDCGKPVELNKNELCDSCRLIRKQKAQERLILAGKVVAGVAAGVAVIATALAEASSEDDYSTNLESYNSWDDSDVTKCAHCGNTNQSTLWDEGDTIFCSLCTHRTSVSTGEDDVVECPYCHRMRDRKAMYCQFCNDSTWEASTDEEFEEIDKDLSDMGY